jgi:hypothetical protein
MNQLAEIAVDHARLPQTYHHARGALEKCSRLDECKDWADKAEALASYAKQAGDETLMKMAIRIRDRAIRRSGELLKQIEPGKPGPKSEMGVGDHTQLGRQAAGEQAGMSKHQQVQAIRVANVPAVEFDRQVESENPPTITALADQGKKSAPKPVLDLQGRDPGEFNRSLHFVAEFEYYAKTVAEFDLDLLLPGLTPPEKARVRAAIEIVDGVHDRIITRI